MPTLRPLLPLLMLLSGAAALAQPPVQSVAAPQPAAVPQAPLRVPGLRAPVEVVRDAAGTPHITAKNEHDLFFAQGYTAAQDRLFQLELWRRQATGTLAEALGPQHLQRDRAARLFRFRGDMRRELAHYHPRGAAIIQAFVAGVNAYVDRVNAAPVELPPEFALLGLRPGRWTPEVVVSRHNALAQNAHQELEWARAVRALGPEAVGQLLVLEPAPVTLALDPALAGASLEDAVLADYALYKAPLAFYAQDVAGPQAPRADEGEGSNNWVVAGTRTASGKPLLANDPHRSLRVPSLRSWVHLRAPGWDVVGGGEPALPGVAIGHNGRGAWGLTVFGIDNEDVYVSETHPEDPLRYRTGKGWERMREVRERVRVRGRPDVEVVLRYTRHGPVLHEDAARRRVYSLRAAWLEVGGAPYLASLRLDQARSWKEARAALAFHKMPALNYVWADTAGTIGWQVAGIAPVRRGWTGLVPVPGDGRYEWAGFLPPGRLPSSVNPKSGVLGTANENNVPEGWPHVGAVGRWWAQPWRAARLREALADVDGLTAEDMFALQLDELHLPSRTLVPLLRSVRLLDPLAVRARQLLLTEAAAGAQGRFPGAGLVLRKESAAAAAYVAWERALVAEVAARAVPPAAQLELAADVVQLTRVVEWVRAPASAPPGLFAGLGEPGAARDALLAETFTQAVRALAARQGGEPSAWRYGGTRFKYVWLQHPLSPVLGPRRAQELGLDVGPLPRGGSAHTLNVTGATDNQGHGATFRIVVDLADFDRSLGTNAPGQSADPRSPHYQDLLRPWAEGRPFTVPYTRQAVEAQARSRVLLVP